MNELPYSKRKQVGNKVITASEFRNSNESEATLQRQCEEYLKIQRIKYIRIPDLAYKNSYIPAGIPDLILFKPADDKFCVACFIELKSKKGKITQGQKNFAKQTPVFLCKSFEHFEKIINEFLNVN